jgi:uncharacterized protein (DUF2235 family)
MATIQGCTRSPPMADQPIHPAPTTVVPTGKNIIICCDGTGNEFGSSNSNVVRLYTALDLSNEEKQVAYYHPGVGTMGAPTARNVIEKEWSRIAGLAFAAGFRDNIFDAYRYLMEIYNQGDRVFLFGFSRGAYTARALSGVLHGYGLLRRGNEGHLAYAWRSFTEQVKQKGDEQAKGRLAYHSVDPNFSFRETFSHDNFAIHFVGLWDTVSSVGWIYTPLRLLYTAKNPLIRTARHAVSIDEHRCFFRDNLYGPPGPGQDIVQVWFPGVHSDVGGSYSNASSGPSNTAFEWILGEARNAGLATIQDRVNLVLGRPTAGEYASAPLYQPAPDPGHTIHESLCHVWRLAELLPQRYYDKSRNVQLLRVPLGVHRFIPAGSIIHSTAWDFLNRKFPGEPVYQPPNLLKQYLQPGAAVPFQTTADLSGFYTYNPPATTLQSASAFNRWIRVILIGFPAFGVFLLLVALICFLLLSAACALASYLCHWIGLFWSFLLGHLDKFATKCG